MSTKLNIAKFYRPIKLFIYSLIMLIVGCGDDAVEANIAVDFNYELIVVLMSITPLIFSIYVFNSEN